MSHPIERQPHVDTNMPLRALKARKIEVLLGLDEERSRGSLLEVGTGSGGIAHYFAHSTSRQWSVSAVDVIDNRQLKDGYDFQLIEGCLLPFADETFDVVISNHVIEHVGDESSQLLHLRELRRVLKPGGRGYLAVPNRWMVVEPHYRVPFLSWLPKRWRSRYLRCFKAGGVYDCEPLTMRGVERLLTAAALGFENICLQALRVILTLENSAAPAVRAIADLPDPLLSRLLPIMPTLIYRLRR
ncbi:class I SAM-dependent methyltransferase [Dyella humicola]|uniref:class I SAM-dependent methyltransferase n=1 Tax=Dyella humicola TaxID=2992126 RepID=UPI002255CC2E|nr:class I SAM-dependent methyltransferase [Dyella humicola]